MTRTSSSRPFWKADRTRTGIRHHTLGRLSATTFRLNPRWKAASTQPSPMPPMTAATIAPRSRSWPLWRPAGPITDGGSPPRGSRDNARTTGAPPSGVWGGWGTGGGVGGRGASEPLSVADCLPRDLVAVSEPISDTNAYRPLPPSETAKTAMTSHQSSLRVGRTQRPAVAGVAAEAEGAPGAGG